MAAIGDLITVEPSVRPNQFDDVLGTCAELELMFGRLRRAHLLPEEEYSTCRREVTKAYELLAERQERWRVRSKRLRLAS
jgi:hypothetical protein